MVQDRVHPGFQIREERLRDEHGPEGWRNLLRAIHAGGARVCFPSSPSRPVRVGVVRSGTWPTATSGRGAERRWGRAPATRMLQGVFTPKNLRVL